MDETHTHILDTVCQKMMDELHDIIEDNAFHNKLLEAGLPREATIIEEIASEELTHARAYRRILTRHGRAITPEAHELWEKVHEIFHLEEHE